ncbi:hypothetical protein QQG74_11555 [Micromonospora sp. FIMYZ51]|uniref:hypothetical protein n=1 Tax=Micromonospora sp. FIMYZ51 TaxID=3051832 RepID=UPI0031202849
MRQQQPFVIGVIVGSSRPGRRGPTVAGWVTEVAAGEGRAAALLAMITAVLDGARDVAPVA